MTVGVLAQRIIGRVGGDVQAAEQRLSVQEPPQAVQAATEQRRDSRATTRVGPEIDLSDGPFQ
jgi:hypothetical protein